MKGPDTREHCTVKFSAKRLADGWREDQETENLEKEYRSALRFCGVSIMFGSF